MKLLVDANIFTRKQKTGVDYYAMGLIWAAARAMPNDQFVLAHFGWGTTSVPADLKNIQVKRIWWLPSKMYGLHRHHLKFLPLEVLMPVRADIMFFPDFGCPVTIQKVPKVTIIHDLVYRLQPEYVPGGHQKFLESLVAQALQQASAVVVNSKSTAADLQRTYGYDSKDIIITPPAVDRQLYKPATRKAIDAVRDKYHIKGDYFLFLSTLEPRKNVANIVRAYDLLPNELKQTHQLVLAGKKGWLDEEIEALCERMGERVIRTGRVETLEKSALYSGAAAFVFPSAYEGFGMPILEAMACGAPVITSNVSSMPEVAGNAAIIVDPNSVKAIADGLTTVITDKKVAQQLSAKGFKRAEQFTWEASGKKLASLFNRLTKS